MHYRGISLRYLGKIASDVKPNFLKEIAIREMIARAFKGIIRKALRGLRELTSKMTEYHLKKMVCHFMNKFFNFRNVDHITLDLWDEITKLVKLKFDITVTRSILDNISLIPLSWRIMECLNAFVLKDFKDLDFQEEEIFLPTDFKFEVCETIGEFSFCPGLDYMESIVSDYEKKCEKSKWNIRTGVTGKFSNLLAEKVTFLAEHIHGDLNIKTAQYLLQKAANGETRHIENGRPEQSIWNKCRGVDEDKFSASARFYYNKVVKTFGRSGIHYHR